MVTHACLGHPHDRYHHPETAGRVPMRGLAFPKGHPPIGRKAKEGLRALVISRGRFGCLALYDYDLARDTAVVLTVRHQRELPK